MSNPDEWVSDEDIAESRYGNCPHCGTPLNNWGAASHGDGDIFDEIGCDVCEEVIEERHASYCTCADCQPWAQMEAEE